VYASQEGYLSAINAREVGETSVDLGAGRVKKGDPIDHAVGIVIHHKVGDFVRKGDLLFTIHANNDSKLREAKERLLAAHSWSTTAVQPLPLFYGVVE
jgi:pyrimidine-nucleoside phosphorylase